MQAASLMNQANPVTAWMLALVLTCCPALVNALASDADQPIHIEGDDAEIDQANETIVYTGSVEVVQGTLRVHGDRMVVKISGDQVQQITTTGGPARYSQELEDDQGQVNAHAKSIVYHTAQERIYLNGKASLVQKGNELHGESIRYDIVNGKVDASAGNKPGRVRMQLDPQARPKRP
ncbi:MAG: lipopolysaccharide transport periplasmic protein LptA [Pseudomonadota bacterium]